MMPRDCAAGFAAPGQDRCEAMQFAYRVTFDPTDRQVVNGDPGPEGVHQDDAVLTAIMLMGRENCTETSGMNRIWTLDQPCGKTDGCEDHLLGNVVLKDRFDS